MTLQERSEKIFEACELLERKEINAALFLNRVTYGKNSVCNHFENFEFCDIKEQDICSEGSEINDDFFLTLMTPMWTVRFARAPKVLYYELGHA